MPDPVPNQPLFFEPIFMERIWGGRRLETLFAKRLPSGVRIGESWEIVDRPEAQSIVRDGPWRGRTLHELWCSHRREVFGAIADAPRFPLLIKLLDARETLSLQVHPPAEIAAELGGEPKTEFWYIAEAAPGAELYAGLKRGSSRAQFDTALRAGAIADNLHRVPVRAGDAMFVPGGRLHAIGAGNVIIEIQQNSDTTYRVFDWNRADASGAPRRLHIAESLRSIDFGDFEPEPITASGESLLKHPLFEIEKWELIEQREVAPPGSFAILACLSGEVSCAGVAIKAGEFFLIPANLEERTLAASQRNTTLLRVTAGSDLPVSRT